MEQMPEVATNKDREWLRDIFLRACSFVPSGVAIVAGIEHGGRPFGLTVSSLTPVSADPPLVSICIERSSQALRWLQQAKKFAINQLSDDQGDLARLFGAAGDDCFRDVSWHAGDTGEPVFDGVVATMFCELVNQIKAGDHELMIVEVKGVELNEGEPLVYWRRGLHRVRREYPFVADAAALESFMRDWETGVLPHRSWTHTAHVAVAAYYAFAYPPEEAFNKTKAGIIHYNLCVGTANSDDSGYHETLTRFWSETIGALLRNHHFASQLDAVRDAVNTFGEDRDRHHLYYSFDVVRHRQARREWIRPDRRPIIPQHVAAAVHREQQEPRGSGVMND